MVEPDGVEIVQIDEALRNGVRKRCGHGCIRCGVTIYLYVRLPIEDEAGVSAPSVVLLCPECLGLLRNRPMASVQYAALLARPIARDPHFDRSQLPYTMLLPEMHVGGSIPVRNTSIPIMIGGHAPLIFSPPTSGVGALHISLQLSGEDGKPCLLIDSNRWCAPEGGWTFSRRGNCYIVESSLSESCCRIEFNARDRLTIVDLRTMVGDRKIELTPGWIDTGAGRRSNLITSGQLIGYRI